MNSKNFILSYLAGLFIMNTFGTGCSKKQSDITTTTDEGNLKMKVQTLASGLNHPWGMAFLPDGNLLITERSGQLRVLDKANNLSEPIAGLPSVFAEGQGGLQDVALDPDFSNNKLVYFTYAEPGPDGTASTALGMGKLENNNISDFKVIFSQVPKVDGGNHFGSRIVFSTDGHIFIALGERFKFDPAQDLTNHLGKIIRIKSDGSIPADNPFVNQQGSKSEIWSYGHRNIEAAAIDPASGKLWIAEMGPKGGDELNQPDAGKNYGWPLVSWGNHYDGKDIPDPTTRKDLVDAIMHWTPVISPSGMEFYTGNMFPEFKGNMLIGGLSSKGIVRVEIKDNKANEVGRIDLGERTRDVAQAPDGSIYVLTDKDNGNVLRLATKAE